MNTAIKISLVSLLILLLSVRCYADSPLTSTDFYMAYLDVPIVKAAADKPNVLTEEMMAYLHDEANPLDVKLALIYAVGWAADGGRLSTFSDYMSYCTLHFPQDKKRSCESGIVTWDDVYDHASPSQMAVILYLYAMSDYSNCSNILAACALMERALENSVYSESFMLSMSLVWAQVKLLMGQWEHIYPSFHLMFDNTLVKDVRPEARKIIYEYIDLYKKYAQE